MGRAKVEGDGKALFSARPLFFSHPFFDSAAIFLAGRFGDPTILTNHSSKAWHMSGRESSFFLTAIFIFDRDHGCKPSLFDKPHFSASCQIR